MAKVKTKPKAKRGRKRKTGGGAGPTRSRAVRVVGRAPATATCALRWSAANNLFWDAGEIGRKLWKASKAEDEEASEKYLCQYVFVKPYEPPRIDVMPLNARELERRVDGRHPKGLVPADTEWFTIGTDLGKRICHWVALAFRASKTVHVVDYGVLETDADTVGVKPGILNALRDFYERSELAGWTWADHGTTKLPDQIWIDARYQPDVVKQFARETNPGLIRPTMGFGASQGLSRWKNYSQPKGTGSRIKHIGLDYHLEIQDRSDGCLTVMVDANCWKSDVHASLRIPPSPVGDPPTPGRLAFFDALPLEHASYAKHLTAEREDEEFVPNVGRRVKWKQLRSANHYLDATYLAKAAGHLCGFRVVAPTPSAVVLAGSGLAGAPVVTMPDGRPFLVTER